MTNAPAEWAVEKACELAQAENTGEWPDEGYVPADLGEDYACKPPLIALARYIEAHEQPPEMVDPLEEVAEELWHMATGPKGENVACMVAFMRERGLELAKPSEPEWIKWHGGKCPVPAGTDCEVRLQNGRTHRDLYPEERCWSANNFNSIKAYRVFP